MKLSARLDALFESIERDAIEDLENSSGEYQQLLDEIAVLKGKYPFLETFFTGKEGITLSAEEHMAIGEYMHLLRWKDIRERNHIYFYGHADAVSYLKKAGALSDTQ